MRRMRGRAVGIALLVFGVGACGQSTEGERADTSDDGTGGGADTGGGTSGAMGGGTVGGTSGAGGTGSGTGGIAGNTGGGPPRTATFHLIEPVQRHLDEAAMTTNASLRTRVSFVSDDLSYVIGASQLSNQGAKVPDEEPILWTLAEGTVALGALPGVDEATDETQVADIDPTGSVVVGWASNAGGGRRAFRWTEATGMVDISPPDAIEAYASLVSDDGSAVTGWFSTMDSARLQIFRWTSAGGAVDLGEIPGGIEGAPAYLSPDGSVVAGNGIPSCANDGSCESTSVFFHWSEEGGMENIGTLPGYTFCNLTFPTEVSYGPMMTGYCGGDDRYEPFIWSEADGLRGLGALPTGIASGPSAVSEDGRVAMFQGRTAAGVEVAWRWTADSGVSEIAPSADYYSVEVRGFRWGMSADGSVAIGMLRSFNETRAVRFTSGGLEMLAVPDGHETTGPLGVSRDGRTIAGSSGPAAGPSNAVAWLNDDVVIVSDALAAAGVALGDGVTLPYASAFPNGVIVGDAYTPNGTLAWIATLAD
jgi:probable HAF family extracellular repeat protein